jgi:hypothetical protein
LQWPYSICIYFFTSTLFVSFSLLFTYISFVSYFVPLCSVANLLMSVILGPHINSNRAIPSPSSRFHVSPRSFTGTNGYYQIGGHRTGPGVQVHMPAASPLNLIPSVPSSGVTTLNHLPSKQPQQFPAPLPPRPMQDQPRLTSLPAPSVVFRKEEISAVSSEISSHNECIGDVIESWDIAAIPLDEEIGRGAMGPIQC